MQPPVTLSPKLIDIGANLSHDSFSPDLEAVIKRASDLGVTQLIVTGTDISTSSKALQLTQSYPNTLFSTAGIHPHSASEFTEQTLEQLTALAANPSVKAIGETGLDYNRNFSTHAKQLFAFEQQLQLAVQLGLPVFVHERDAAEDMLAMLKKYRSQLDKIVIHCFTGQAAELNAYLDLDLHIGITGWICDERRGVHLQALVKLIPTGRLMLETDCPYLLPRDYPEKKSLKSSRRNEPCTLPHIAATIARCRGETLADLAQHCYQTSVDFFGLK